MAKVLIGIVTSKSHHHCLDEFSEALKAQTTKADVLFVVNNGDSAYCSLIKSKGFDAVEDPSKAETRIQKIISGRNFLRDHALKNNYDYLFCVDSDIILPAQSLEALLLINKDVATGIYLNAMTLGGKKVIAPVVYKDLGNGECQVYNYEGIAVAQLIEVGAAGLGCTLISRKVLEKVKFRKMSDSSTGGEDIAFYLDARASGFKTVANTLVKGVHRPYPKDDPRARLFEWRTNVESDVSHYMKY